jgi:hypothetical protein
MALLLVFVEENFQALMELIAVGSDSSCISKPQIHFASKMGVIGKRIRGKVEFVLVTQSKESHLTIN